MSSAKNSMWHSGVVDCLSHVWLCNPMDCSFPRLLCPKDFPCKNTRVGCHFLLQGFFPTRNWTCNLLHWQVGSLPLNHLRSPCDIQYCSVTQLCLATCDPMDSSTPGLPVPHHLQKFARVHVHCIGDAIQPSHPLMPSFPSWMTASSWWRSLGNSMKLGAMLCRATQDNQVIAESSDKMWSTSSRNGKPPRYTCRENLMNCIKGQKDVTFSKPQ